MVASINDNFHSIASTKPSDDSVGVLGRVERQLARFKFNLLQNTHSLRTY